MSARDGRLVGQSAVGGTVAVDAVRPGAERDRVPRDAAEARPASFKHLLKLERDAQRRLRITTAGAAAAHGARELAARDEAHAAPALARVERREARDEFGGAPFDALLGDVSRELDGEAERSRGARRGLARARVVEKDSERTPRARRR